MPLIQKFINNRHQYLVDTNYQRPAGVWSTEDKQYLIDTILMDEPMPLFFLNYISEKDIYYIVDGQQRLDTIKDFYDNKFKLNGKFSGISNHKKTFNGPNPLTDKQRSDFLEYNLSFKILKNYNDEKVRLIFSRLQRGKPLTLGERLNAKPGEIVPRMRTIAKHPFMAKSIGISKKRYGNYPDAARILFYEKYRAQQCGTNELLKFFEDFSNMAEDSKEFKNSLSNLNFLTRCFPTEPGDYKHLSRHAWVNVVYNMIHDLRKAYSLKGKEEIISKFIRQFHSLVYDEDFRTSNRNYQRFYDNIRGGWSEKIITLRKTILIQEFLKSYEIDELDDKRQLTDEEKIAAFSKQSICEVCGYIFKDYKEAEYHHKIKYVEGGRTRIDNIKVLCVKCHKTIHGKEDIELPPENEIDENDN